VREDAGFRQLVELVRQAPKLQFGANVSQPWLLRLFGALGAPV